MNLRYRIVLVEDHPIVRDGLRILLSKEKDFEIVGEAGNGREALRLVQKAKPDLIITDLSMPKMDGMELIATIKKQSPKIKIAVLTVNREKSKVAATLKARADAYIVKEATYPELVFALRSVLKGKHYLSPEISGDLIKGYLQGNGVKEEAPSEILTGQELEILKQIATGAISQQIADQLCISKKTVQSQRLKIMKKLNVNNVAAMIMVAKGKGLLYQ